MAMRLAVRLFRVQRFPTLFYGLVSEMSNAVSKWTVQFQMRNTAHWTVMYGHTKCM